MEVEKSFPLVREILQCSDPTSEVMLLTVVGKYHSKDRSITIDVEQGFWPVKRPWPHEAHLRTSYKVYEKADTKGQTDLVIESEQIVVDNQHRAHHKERTHQCKTIG